MRTGKYSFQKVLTFAEEMFAACEQAAGSSALPEKVDRAAVSRLLADSYREAWGAG